MESKPWDATQKLAIERCTDVKRRICAVTGEAGTGKTSIMKEVYEQLTAAGYSVAMCALAGKAAKRITEATGIEAKTIHRTLEFTFPGERDEKTGKVYGISVPKKNAQNPLHYDFILADEYFMVHQDLHRDLINAIKGGAGLRVFGDANQLPPIEESEHNKNKPPAFQELFDKWEGIRLTEIHRTGKGSSIPLNGHRILGGIYPVKTDDYGINITSQPVKYLQDFILEWEDRGVSYKSLDNQIITPRAKKCWIGAVELNNVVQPLFHETLAGAMIVPRHKWEEGITLRLLVGDKIIYTRNDYNLSIFNGETGIVTELTDSGEIIVDFGDRSVCIPPLIIYQRQDGGEGMYDPRREIQLAYVITTHKAQGSEYLHTTYLMGKASNFLLNRANFYTATTRAREHCEVITDQWALAASVQRKKPMG